MRKGFVAAAFALTALAVGFSSNEGSARPSAAAKPLVPARVLGLSWEHGGALARFDPVSLRALAGRKVRLDTNIGGWSYSPDGSRIALGVGASRVQIVHVRRMRTERSLQTRRLFQVQADALAWLKPRRLVVLDSAGLVVLDPVAKRVVRRPMLLWWPVRLAVARKMLVLLLVNPNSLAPARLATVDADGRVRSVSLERIFGGTRHAGDGSPTTEVWQPGLALDVAANRAFVIGANSPAAEVDLRSLRVTYHALSTPSSLLRRFRNWLDPAALTKGPMPGPRRQALWLGQGMLAVTGENGGESAGLSVIDSRDWSVREIDADASALSFNGETLLAYTDRLHYSRGHRGGLRAYATDGSERFNVLDGEPAWVAAVVGTRAWVYLDGRHAFKVVDTASAEISDAALNRTPEGFPQLLLGKAQRR